MTGINETTFGSNSISESKKGGNAANESSYAGSENLRNQKQNIEFSGNSSEYFGIWIVNIFLSIVTLGIYSAWAKVRRENYFKNNTKISGIGFGYHATGLQILRGRLIAVAFLVAINIAVSIYPILAGLTVPIFLFLVPWILNTSMRFAARMTSYRNIRFNWHGTYWKTFWFLVIAPALSLLTLGLLLPWASKSCYSYIANFYPYGTSRFSCQLRVRDFYFYFFIGSVLPVLLTTCGAYLFFSGLMIEESALQASDEKAFANSLILLSVFAYFFIFLVIIVYSVLCRNLMVRSLTLSDVARFDSNLSGIKFVWISLSNLVAIMLSIGLLIPWATIRMHAYLSESTQIEIVGDVDKFVDEALTAQSAFGESIADFEGIEVLI
ncbi:MAG TPA: DUF898 domain-containing protein [Alphaproteobacteria bacterium]|nr:DUF898 domain-containing protein [Alphaproteobacteria bacterium]